MNKTATPGVLLVTKKNEIKMKKIILLLIVMMMSVSSSYAIFDKYTIKREELPEEAQSMLKEYFPKAKVSMIKVDKHLLKKTDYDVRLVNGSTIEFNNKGKWTSVDCKSREVPSGLVNKTIKKYVEKNFPDTYIVKIEKKSGGTEIELNDGIELKFNLLNQIKKVEMED